MTFTSKSGFLCHKFDFEVGASEQCQWPSAATNDKYQWPVEHAEKNKNIVFVTANCKHHKEFNEVTLKYVSLRAFPLKLGLGVWRLLYGKVGKIQKVYKK